MNNAPFYYQRRMIYATCIFTFCASFSAEFTFDCPPSWNPTLDEKYAHWTVDNAEIDRILKNPIIDFEDQVVLINVLLLIGREVEKNTIKEDRKEILALMIEKSLEQLPDIVFTWPKKKQFDAYCNTLSIFQSAIPIFSALAPDYFSMWPLRLKNNAIISDAGKTFILSHIFSFLQYSKANTPMLLSTYESLIQSYPSTEIAHFAGSVEALKNLSFRMHIFSINEIKEVWEYIAENVYVIEDHRKDPAYTYFAHLCASMVALRPDGLNVDVLLSLEDESEKKNNWKQQYFYLLSSAYILNEIKSLSTFSDMPNQDVSRIAIIIQKKIDLFYSKNKKAIDLCFNKLEDDMLRKIRTNLLSSLALSP